MYAMNSRRLGYGLVTAAMLAAGLSTGTRLYYLIALALLLMLALGVSTRGAISLLRAAQAAALLDGRDFVRPEDVQKMAEPVLAHRLVLSPEARMRNMTAQKILSNVMGNVPVPVKVKNQ